MHNQGKDKGVMSSILTELGVLRPEQNSDEALTVHQQEIIAAFQSGRMTEDEFRKQLSQDPGLSVIYLILTKRPQAELRNHQMLLPVPRAIKLMIPIGGLGGGEH